jgi:hypothetical protein
MVIAPYDSFSRHPWQQKTRPHFYGRVFKGVQFSFSTNAKRNPNE